MRKGKKFLAAVMALVMVAGSVLVSPISTGAAEEGDTVTGLMGYYTFDETLVDSVTGKSAKIHGGAGDSWNATSTGTATYVEGVNGKAYKFTGDVDSVRGEGLELAAKSNKSEATICAWIDPENFGVGTTSMIFGVQTVNTQDDACFSVNSFNNFKGTVFLGKIWDWENRNDTFVCLDGDLDGNRFAVDKGYAHLVITVKEGEQRLYINGVEIASSNSTNPLVYNNLKDTTLFLGINWWDASFAGAMDDVAVYNRALTAADVSKLYADNGVPDTEGVTIITSPLNGTAADSRKKTGDFDITYKFHNESSGTNTWENYVIELRDSENNCVDVRADYAGWTWTPEGGMVNFPDSYKGGDAWLDGYTVEEFNANMQAGVDVTVNIAKAGDTVVVTTDNGFCKFKYTVPFALTGEVTIGLGGEMVKISNLVVTDNSADNKYNMENYRSGAEYVAPSIPGKAFAGWFTDSACTTPVAENVKTGYAYAKFVDEAMLSAKYQLTAGTTANSATTDIRVMMALDSLDYKEAGFSIKYNGSALKDYAATTVYSGISVTTPEGTTVDTPDKYFGADAEYMLPYALRNLKNANFDKTFEVTSYWVTLDGTRVEGVRSFTVNDSWNNAN